MTTTLSIPTLPDTAPFSTGQRAWLNGFFAGMVSTSTPGAPTADVDTAAPAHEEEAMPWHDAALNMADRMKLADGKPGERVLMAAMAQLDCGSCGYLCQTYAEAIAAGEEKNLTLCSPGGKETAAKLKELVALGIKATPRAKPATGDAAVRPAAGAPKYDRKNPFAARLVAAHKLNRPGSDKDTRHVIFDLKGSSLTYKPGDAMGVWPENCPDLVDEIVARLRCTGAEDVVSPDGQPTSLYEALTHQYTLTHPTDEVFALLGVDPTENVALVDVLREAADAGRPVPDPTAFVAALSPMQPRLYSISSALSAHPDQVHLTVGVVRYKSGRGTTCKGCASTFLAERMRPGRRARIFFHASAKFGLPADGAVPVIMVGPGTGIAPFRSFLADRKATAATGKNWLFFGDQKSATDFLYEDEITAYRNDGTLTRLSLAFSRDQKHKVYVQTRMLEEGRELWEWLQQGAHFYVCGDAKRMANDVDEALKQVVMERGGLTADAAAAYVAQMAKDGRYQRDVY